MSILIKGMSMPKNCGECPLLNYHSPCWKNGGVVDWENRPDWCPLIEVPPHGDLIGREWLIDIALHLMNTAKNDDIANGVKWLWQYVIEAPTIIEADKDTNVLGKEEEE